MMVSICFYIALARQNHATRKSRTRDVLRTEFKVYDNIF